MPPKKEKDPNAPKRPMGPFFLWLQENREQLKEQGFKGSDAAKEGGRLWRELGDKSEWESKAADLKKNYEKEMMAYNAGK